jgi:hypothetical protein
MSQKEPTMEWEKLEKIVGGFCWAQDGGNGGYEFDDIKKFVLDAIASAKEEQRQSVKREIEEKLPKEKPILGYSIMKHQFEAEGYNIALSDVKQVIGEI